MSEVIYRKYRAKNFDQIIGQDHVKQVLLHQIKNDDISHAYLFAGPRGTGKTSMARLLAKEANKIGENDFGFNLDIIEIDAASNRGIEEIRQLKENVNFAPSSSKYKVYIIDEVHMLTKEAFNALLKTLEEPPSHIIFIMATTEPEKVPITILSRVMRFDFKLATREQLAQKLKFIIESESKDIQEEALDIIIDLGKGSFRDAESILGKVLTSSDAEKIKKKDIEKILGLADSDIIDEFVVSVLSNNKKESFELLSQVENRGINVVYFINQTLEKLRKMMLKKSISGKGDYTLKNIVSFIKSFIEANENLRYTSIELLPVEIAIAELFDNNENNTVKISKSTKTSSQNKKKPKKEKEKKQEKKKNDVEEEEEEQTENTEVAINVELDSNLKVEDIRSKWKVILSSIKKQNNQLMALLSKAQPIKIEGSILFVNIGYKFHQSRIESESSKKILRKVFSEVFGGPIIIKCIIDKNLKNLNFDDEVTVDSNEEIVEELFSE